MTLRPMPLEPRRLHVARGARRKATESGVVRLAKEEFEVRGIVVREAIAVVPSEAEGTPTVVYDGEMDAYTGGLGMFDEGGVHVCRTALVNLTPHEIVVRPEDGSELRIPPSGVVARCSVRRKKVGEIGGIPVNRTLFGDVEGLPEQRLGTYYIVSAIVAQACPGRHDLLITDDAVRDEQGRIIGCRALATVAR